MLFMQRKFQKPKEVYLKRIYKNQINFDLSKVHDQNVIKVFVKKKFTYDFIISFFNTYSININNLD